MLSLSWPRFGRHWHPMPGVDYFHHYFATIESIARGDRKRVRRIRTIQALLVLSSVANGLTFVVPVDVAWQREQILLFDFYGFNHYPAVYRLIMSGVALNMCLFYQVFYFQFHHNPMRQVLQDCFDRDGRQRRCRRQHRHASKIVCRSMLYVLVAFQHGIVLVALYIGAACIQLTVALVHEVSFDHSVQMYASLLTFTIFGFLFTVFNLFSISVCSLATSIMLGTSILFHHRYHHIATLLRPCAPPRLQCRRLLRFVAENVRTLLWMRHQDGFFGPVLTVLLVVCLPMNAVLLVTATTNAHLGYYQARIILAIALNELMLLQTSHLIAAQFSAQLHNRYQRVMSLNLRLGHYLTLRQRVHLWANIQAMHVTNKYGLNYSLAPGLAIGAITTAAFLKLLFLYSEGIFFNVTMARKL